MGTLIDKDEHEELFWPTIGVAPNPRAKAKAKAEA